MSKWPDVDVAEFKQSGMLYRANRDFFWPLGLALAVTKNEDGTYERTMRLLTTDPAEVIEDPSAELDALSDAWMAKRLDGIIR